MEKISEMYELLQGWELKTDMNFFIHRQFRELGLKQSVDFANMGSKKNSINTPSGHLTLKHWNKIV
jgi:phage anti-repressor protein